MSESTEYKVVVVYPLHSDPSDDEAIDASVDRLAVEAGEVLDSGAGSGFGMRDLDYLYATLEEARRLEGALTRELPHLQVQVAEVLPDQEE